MSSKWHQKKEKEARIAFERDLQSSGDNFSENLVKADLRDAAMGGGEDELFEKKLTKEEKKVRAKAIREAKKLAKMKAKGIVVEEKSENEQEPKIPDSMKATMSKTADADGLDQVQADILASEGTICTFASSRKGVDARSRDIKVSNFTLLHKGSVMLDESEVTLNHGNRYGLIGRNGCGKSTLMRALGARAIPIPKSIDIFFLKEEIEPSKTVSALEAVMSVDQERLNLEKQAEELNQLLSNIGENPDDYEEEDGKTADEVQEEVMDTLNSVYERLDALDADTAEVRARIILKGLGFTHEMQSKKTADFSGGWRMRVSLARALFIQPVCLLLDEPTNHLDMEAVIWLEDYLSKWNRILLLVSHSQDFLNNVCTHMIHFTNKRNLTYYDGNYDQFVKTKSEKEENQWKQYKWEQDQMKSMKDYVAKFGHGTSKNAKQAQSKEKVLAKMIRAGLTDKPEEEKMLNFKFPNPGHLPPPVLSFRDVSFGYPNCQPLYTNVNLGVDLDSRVALVGPNGAGKTTLVKLMSSELEPSLGDIRPHGHLKMGRFTQHFVDVLDLSLTPLEFFEKMYPADPREEQRKYLGRFGVSGKMQVQKMSELSDGQCSRVVFAKLGRDVPHILLLDEPTNHLDMESIDALAKAVNEFEGGLVLVSHDMRLISQVAKEIWICDNKQVQVYKGDIQSFKLDMRDQMGLEGQQHKLKGDASQAVKVKELAAPKPKAIAKEEPRLEIIVPKAIKESKLEIIAPKAVKESATAPKGSYVPPHLRKKLNS